MRRLRNRDIPIPDLNLIDCYEDMQPVARATLGTCFKVFMLLLAILYSGGLVFIWNRQELLRADVNNIVKNSENTVSDFALELNGARIISVEAKPVVKNSLLGVSLCNNCENSKHEVSKLIQPSMAPGECWAFQGERATAVIKLSQEVLIRAVTLEHLEKKYSPSHKSNFAPRNFKVWGINDFTNIKESEKILLGEFEYDVNGDPSQKFTTQYISKHFEYVAFEVLTNHGNPGYTCVYRLKVHGYDVKSAFPYTDTLNS